MYASLEAKEPTEEQIGMWIPHRAESKQDLLIIGKAIVLRNVP